MIARILAAFALLLSFQSLQAQDLYHKWFGEAGKPAVVFLHGGPGYNAASFEADMAKRVADYGYQVLVYDQRGSGRSEGLKGEFTYAEAVADLKGLLDAHGTKQAVLLGHSFGGSVALKFAEKHPDMVKSIVLISAPVDFPKCFRSIQNNCWKVFDYKEDPAVKNIEMLRKMDSTSLEYATTSFGFAMQAGLYSPDEPLKQGTKVRKKVGKSDLAPWMKKSSYEPVKGFYTKEHYTTAVFTPLLKEVAQTIPVYGIFGEDDGLFEYESLQEIQDIIGSDHYYSFSSASHSVFLDDPYGFLDALAEVLMQ
jgi:proline iminopeptidase